MDLLQQYLRETRDAGRLPSEAEFEMFKAGPTDPRPIHPLAHHARYRGAGGRPFSAPVQPELGPASRHAFGRLREQQQQRARARRGPEEAAVRGCR
jgi:hypothetical protein